MSKNGTTPLQAAQKGVNYVDFNNVGPRVGIYYDLSGRGTRVIKASFGHYYNYPAADYVSALNPNAGWSYVFKWGTTGVPLSGGRTGNNLNTYYQPGDPLPTLQSFTGRHRDHNLQPELETGQYLPGIAYLEQQIGSLWDTFRLCLEPAPRYCGIY